MIKSPIRTKDRIENALDRFWETVPPLWGQVRGHVRSVATEKLPISVEQFQILRLVRSGRTSVSGVAAAKNISRSAVSQAVEVLVNKQLLTRTEDAADRRQNQLALTASGNAMLDTIFDDTRAWMRLKLAALDEAELENIIDAMASLKKLLD
jgi:DNA-binding MarR family transcriptional regulator